MLGVHRIVEIHAAERGSEIALVDTDGALTYSELNRRANALARYLIEQGLRRGCRAVVRMKRCPELAIALLAVLKAGAAYTWMDPADGDTGPAGVSLVGDADSGDQAQAVLDIRPALDASSRSAPNLPILTRSHDIACVIPQRDGAPRVLVPHATIVALRAHPLPTPARWSSDPGALDLWLPLMAGSRVMLEANPESAAA